MLTFHSSDFLAAVFGPAVGPRMCTPCKALKTFALKLKPAEAAPMLTEEAIDKRVPRVTVALPLLGANMKVPTLTFEMLHTAKTRTPGALDPAANELPFKPLNSVVIRKKLTRKERVARWKVKRRRMLAKPRDWELHIAPRVGRHPWVGDGPRAALT